MNDLSKYIFMLNIGESNKNGVTTRTQFVSILPQQSVNLKLDTNLYKIEQFNNNLI